MATKTTTPKKLTAAEKQAIVKAAGKAMKFSKRKLTADKRDEILQIVEALKGKKKPVVGKEAIALWAAKIDFAIANGDHLTVAKLIKAPVGPERARQFYDTNGGCSCRLS